MDTIVQMRPARSGDLGRVAEIYAHYVHNTTITFAETELTASEWESRLAQGLPFLVAESGGSIVGTAYCSPWKSKSAYRYTVENTIYLAPAEVGRGTGTLLLRELIALCAEAGLRELVAVIAGTGESASVKLHERCGFEHAGRLRGVGVKHGHTLDTVLMQLHLNGVNH
ncbi:GNAT family N-acetyltransferase [Amycolatopsis sp. H20-H5]|uniref:GNAT family N-acetyltransferase n=1 Tax=Amycolatopsis sp. H20-H5 TaxID=3046309 RepID=UPI002DBFAF7A|nr:GNAT family N-acetyltransferase [Amycolatopsis sp. H20-H5]MEC3977844.1 GNAT family N-acetyltransferase [Amycolatopsis sp. H20-H5]